MNVESPQPEQYRSIFSQDPVWTQPTATVNNIVINNYNGYAQQLQNAHPLQNAQAFFPNMQQLVMPQQAFTNAADLSQVTQAGGIKPVY